MTPRDGQLSLFELDDADQALSTPVFVSADAGRDRGDAREAAYPTRTAGLMPEPDSYRRPSHGRLAPDADREPTPERVASREQRRRSPAGLPLLSPEDVACRCGVSRKAVYRAVARGELRAARILSRLRIDPADLEAWLRANVIDVQSATPSSGTPRLPPSTGLRRLLSEP